MITNGDFYHTISTYDISLVRLVRLVPIGQAAILHLLPIFTRETRCIIIVRYSFYLSVPLYSARLVMESSRQTTTETGSVLYLAQSSPQCSKAKSFVSGYTLASGYGELPAIYSTI